jgi:ribulose-phosphate 3-epimerase
MFSAMAHHHSTILAPSILAGNHGNLVASAKQVEDLKLRWLHVDIMDGHFVPNLTFGPATVAALRKEIGLFLDVHLMLDNPHHHIDAFLEAGSDLITIHVEPDYPIEETLEKIRKTERFAGLALNPATPVDEVLPFLDQVDLILVMTVEPGFGGQSFREDMLDKLRQIHEWRQERGLGFRLEVDGGINEETGLLCMEAGADTLVAGTSFFAAADKEAFVMAFPETGTRSPR